MAIKKSSTLYFLTFICLGMLFGAASANQLPPAERPVWSDGLYWKYFDEARQESLEYWVLGVRVIREVDHYVLAQRNQRDGETSIDLAFAPVRSPFPRRTNTPDSQTYLDFPLEVNLVWTVREAASAGFLNASQIDAQIETVEVVETLIGPHESFRVDYQREDDTWSLWYSPRLKSWIKQTNPVNDSVFLLQETWQFTQPYVLDLLYNTIEPLLETDRLGMRRLLNNLIQFEFDAARAEALKAML